MQRCLALVASWSGDINRFSAPSLEALLVPSAANRGGKGIVYFPDHKSAHSTLEIINIDQLPTHVP